MYCGHVLSWEKGNLQYFDNTDFIYNDSGIRIAKGSTDYFVKGNQILAEKRGSTVIHYYYDENGVAGFEYAGQQYYYRKNLQGDIIGIYDSCGNLLGVETAVEWDGNSDLTIPIWNYIEGDEDFCRFCIFVTLKGDFLKGNDFNLYLESFLTLGFEDKVFSIHAVSSVYEPKMRGVRSQINEIYAEIVDGVDVGARERILGNTVMNRKSPAGYFMSNKYERSYKVTTWWQRYVSQMTRI